MRGGVAEIKRHCALRGAQTRGSLCALSEGRRLKAVRAARQGFLCARSGLAECGNATSKPAHMAVRRLSTQKAFSKSSKARAFLFYNKNGLGESASPSWLAWRLVASQYVMGVVMGAMARGDPRGGRGGEEGAPPRCCAFSCASSFDSTILKSRSTSRRACKSSTWPPPPPSRHCGAWRRRSRRGAGGGGG